MVSTMTEKGPSRYKQSVCTISLPKEYKAVSTGTTVHEFISNEHSLPF